MSIVILGSTSGSITLQEPAVAGTTTISLPASTGTMALLQTPSFATTIGVGGATPSTSGAGITFPATQSASTDANTLDDYEEGTFTPTDASGASLSFTEASGSYRKIGSFVTLWMRILYPTTANGSSAKIGGFPFSNTSNGGGFMLGSNSGLNLNFRYETATSTHISSGGNFTAVTNSQLSAKEVQLIFIFTT